MDFFSVIQTRASALKLQHPAPDRAQLEQIINAGCNVPDHGRLSPWRIVVPGSETRAQMGEVLAASFLASNPQADAAQVQRERDKATRAPAMIVIAAHVIKDHKIPEIEQLIAVGAAVENMFLAAHALDFGVMWKTGGAAYNAQVNELLGFAADEPIIGILHIGTTEMAGKPRGAVNKEPVRWLP